MTQAEEIYHRFVRYEWNEIGEGIKKSILEAINEGLEQGFENRNLPISCIHDFEKVSFCDDRNNHLCQKCKSW
jgi:hypothetical protein